MSNKVANWIIGTTASLMVAIFCGLLFSIYIAQPKPVTLEGSYEVTCEINGFYIPIHKARIQKSDLGWRIITDHGTEYVTGGNCIAELHK